MKRSSQFGGKSGGRGRGGKRSGGRGSGRDFGVRSMHKAVCDNCGKSCEVPFRPSGDKPIFCDECFEQMKNENVTRSGQKGFRKTDREERKMFTVVCDECGEKCEVPFRPTAGKPVYCDKCFASTKSGRGGGGSRELREQLESINLKLDQILTALAVKPVKETIKKESKIKEEKESRPKKSEKKTALKKTTAKKAAFKETKVKKPVAKKNSSKKKK